MKQSYLKTFTLFAFIASLVGCGQQTTPSPSETGGDESNGSTASAKKVIAFSKMNSNNPFFEVIADGMREEAAKHGYDVQVVSAEADVAKQKDQVNDFITQKVDAIVLNPADSASIGPAIKAANKAGIPVFTADLQCTDPDAKVTAHIATDNYQGGKLAGDAMIEALGGSSGEIAILTHDPAASCIDRVKGFDEVINAHNESKPDAKITVVKRLPCEGARDPGFKATEDIITAHPNLIGIFAINDPGALGAHAALEKHGKSDQVKIIGFDGQPDGKQAIKEGKIYADPIQFPAKMGMQTVKAIHAYFAGEDVKPVQLIPAELYRQADGKADTSLN